MQWLKESPVPLHEINYIGLTRLLAIHPDTLPEIKQMRRGIKPYLLARLPQNRRQQMADGTFAVRPGHMNRLVCFMRIA